jgi:hypothetical protein
MLPPFLVDKYIFAYFRTNALMRQCVNANNENVLRKGIKAFLFKTFLYLFSFPFFIKTLKHCSIKALSITVILLLASYSSNSFLEPPYASLSVSRQTASTVYLSPVQMFHFQQQYASYDFHLAT